MTDFDIQPPEFSDEQFDQWSSSVSARIGVNHLALCRLAIAWATPIVAQAAADAELEACCAWLRSHDILEPAIDALRAVRRPSLKDQALKAICPDVSAFTDSGSLILSPKEQNIILRALESIPDETPTP